jgi:hypothetical protein
MSWEFLDQAKPRRTRSQPTALTTCISHTTTIQQGKFGGGAAMWLLNLLADVAHLLLLSRRTVYSRNTTFCCRASHKLVQLPDCLFTRSSWPQSSATKNGCKFQGSSCNVVASEKFVTVTTVPHDDHLSPCFSHHYIREQMPQEVLRKPQALLVGCFKSFSSPIVRIFDHLYLATRVFPK